MAQQTPKEKAEELVNKFYYKTDEERILVNKYWSNAKYCALIAVDEILNEYPPECPQDSYEWERHLYWKQVKQEIEKL
jgi:hypothetical protein